MEGFSGEGSRPPQMVSVPLALFLRCHVVSLLFLSKFVFICHAMYSSLTIISVESTFVRVTFTVSLQYYLLT